MAIVIPGTNPIAELTQSQTSSLSSLGFAKEVYLQMHPQHTDRWTENGTYTDVVGSINSIDFADWLFHNWYFEMIGFTDVNTGYWQLVNIGTGNAVTGSEITTTSTTSVRTRSGTLTKPAGVNTFKIQHKISPTSAGKLVNSVMSRSVFRVG